MQIHPALRKTKNAFTYIEQRISELSSTEVGNPCRTHRLRTSHTLRPSESERYPT